MQSDPSVTRVVISDLHIGNDDDFDIFKAPGKIEAFENFLNFCGQRETFVELVINGDFVDFLQLRPWTAYGDRAVALSKAQQIVSASARVFDALGKFLQKANHGISVLLGNHDVELAYDEVWAVVRDAILRLASGSADRLIFKNRATQYNVSVGGVLVHIEHGNLRDPWNEILYKELFDDAEKKSGFHYPPGTLFVYDLMNDFKEKFPFVDLLKPEMPAVPLLLAGLKPLATAGALPAASLHLLNVMAEGIVGRVRRVVGGGAWAWASEFAPLGPPLSGRERAYAEMAQAYVDQVSEGTPKKFTELQLAHLEDLLTRTVDVESDDFTEPSLGRRWESVKSGFVNAALRQLGRPDSLDDLTFYAQDHEGHDVDAALEELKGDVRIAVFGHTHAALKNEFANGHLYLNCGTWANLIELPKERKEFSDWLRRIADNTFDRTSFPTYVTLEPVQDGAAATLNYWSATGEKALWTKVISASK